MMLIFVCFAYRGIGEPSSNEEIAPIIPATISEEPWCPHNYTNVDFAHASAQGQGSKKSNSKM